MEAGSALDTHFFSCREPDSDRFASFSLVLAFSLSAAGNAADGFESATTLRKA